MDSGWRPHRHRFVAFGIGCVLTPATALAASWIDAALEKLTTGPTHIQLQAASASETDFGPSLVFGYDQSAEKTWASGLTIGKPLADSVFGWPVEIIGYIGLQRFYERGLQSDITGASVYFKFHKTVTIPGTRFPVRFGLGQGLSYVSRIPVVEQRDFLPAESEKLLIYLEYSVQVSLAHLLGKGGGPLGGSVDDVYVGYTVLHRSSGYGALAETGGGVNYLGFGVEIVLR